VRSSKYVPPGHRTRPAFPALPARCAGLLVFLLLAGCSALPRIDLESILEEVLVRPGPGQPLSVERPGHFFTSSRGNPNWRVEVPVETGISYSRAVMEFDFVHGGYHSSLFHGLCNLRSDKLLVAVQIRADRSKTILDRGNGQSKGAAAPWQPGQRFHVKLTYDAAGRQNTFQLSTGGRVVQTLTAPTAGRPLATNRVLTFGLSQPRVADNAFFPLWGSRFYDLSIRVEP